MPLQKTKKNLLKEPIEGLLETVPPISRRKKRLRNTFKALLGCFLLSIVFWTVNQLNKEHETSFIHSLIYQAEGPIYIDPLPRQVVLEVQAKGWDLLRHIIRQKPIKYPVLHAQEKTIIERRLKRVANKAFPHLSIKKIYPQFTSQATYQNSIFP